jgi:hypothetical protein
MLPSWCRQTVTVIRPTLATVRGTQVQTWTDAITRTVSGCEVQRNSTARDFDGRTLSIDNGAIMFAPIDADIQAGDRIEFDGATYEINGEPMKVRGATGNLAHLEIPLREWSG